ncbi:hypothetical protein N9B88_03850 [Rubripirellula sp.]|nr:hypothetical protein [Rubripirellula sp.]
MTIFTVANRKYLFIFLLAIAACGLIAFNQAGRPKEGAPRSSKSQGPPPLSEAQEIVGETQRNAQSLASIIEEIDQKVKLYPDFKVHIQDLITHDQEKAWLSLKGVGLSNPPKVNSGFDEILDGVLQLQQDWVIENALFKNSNLEPETWQDRIVELADFQANEGIASNQKWTSQFICEDLGRRTQLQTEIRFLEKCRTLQPYINDQELEKVLSGISWTQIEYKPDSMEKVFRVLATYKGDDEGRVNLHEAIQTYVASFSDDFKNKVHKQFNNLGGLGETVPEQSPVLAEIGRTLNAKQKELSSWLFARDKKLLGKLAPAVGTAEEELFSEIEDLLTPEKLRAICSEFDGSIERWYREPEYIARSIARHIGTPALIRLQGYRMSRAVQKNYCRILNPLVHFLESQCVIESMTEKSEEALHSSWKHSGNGSFQNWYGRAARDIVRILKNNEESDAITIMKPILSACLARAIKAVLDDDPFRYGLIVMPSQIESQARFWTPEERIVEIDSLRINIAAIRFLAEADVRSADHCLEFSRTNLTEKKVVEFQESLTGFVDSPSLIAESISEMDMKKVLTKKLKAALLNDIKLAILCNKISEEYQLAVTRIKTFAFLNLQNFPQSHPQSLKLQRKLKANLGNQFFDSNGLLIADAAIIIAEEIDMAMSVGIVVFGGGGAGIMKGLITAAVVEALRQVFLLGKKTSDDIQRTQILHCINKELVNSHLGQIYTHDSTRIGGAEIEVAATSWNRAGPSPDPLGKAFRDQIVKFLPGMKEALFVRLKH